MWLEQVTSYLLEGIFWVNSGAMSCSVTASKPLQEFYKSHCWASTVDGCWVLIRLVLLLKCVFALYFNFALVDCHTILTIPAMHKGVWVVNLALLQVTSSSPPPPTACMNPAVSPFCKQLHESSHVFTLGLPTSSHRFPSSHQVGKEKVLRVKVVKIHPLEKATDEEAPEKKADGACDSPSSDKENSSQVVQDNQKELALKEDDSRRESLSE